MKIPVRNFGLILLATSLLTSCGSSDGDSNKNPGNDPKITNRVEWSAVPSEYDPRTEDINFRTEGFERIYVDAFGFDDDVEIIYSPDVPVHSGFVRIFKVWKKSASWGDLRPRTNGTSLELRSNGSYQCSIQISNGQIAALEGGCYVRLQVFLPVGAELEVYNVGQLISKRFIPIDTKTFLDQFDDAFKVDDKFAIIENFLASYSGMSKAPSLTSEELGTVIGDFFRSEEKLRALRRLHSIVSDRQNLNAMIDDKFNYFEREEAKRIVNP